jgi:hypothetical protein
MMLRELMMNALEAANLAPESQRYVIFSVRAFDGVPKLAIWNTGPGMDGEELYQMCDLAASIRKNLGLDDNFGMGAKVASLPSNRFGLRYRSCKGGLVHEVILCQRAGVYGRLRRRSEDGSYLEVIDVTDLARAEGFDLTYDWTEVMLLGNNPDQDTARDPFDGDPPSDTQWLANYLYHRFYRLPVGTFTILNRGTHKLGDGTRKFETLAARIEAGVFERAESVIAEDGIVVHYVYDAPYERSPSHNRSVSGGLQSDVSVCAIVYKDEMYDVRKGRTWTIDAPLFGIPFGARHISIHIELPSNSAARPEGYRQFLRRVQGEQSQVHVTDYAQLVAKYRPKWLVDLIRLFAPDSPSTDAIRSELQRLLDELRVKRVTPRTDANGQISLGSGDGTAVTSSHTTTQRPSANNAHHHIDLTEMPEGARRADLWKNRERAPEIIPVWTEAEVAEKEMKGRAGRYYANGQLFINMLYPAVHEMAAQLEREYANAPDIEQLRQLAKQLSEETIQRRVGYAVVYALAKQENKEWTLEAVNQALVPESLSLAADAYRDSLQSARRKIGTTFRLARQPIESEQSDVGLH